MELSGNFPLLRNGEQRSRVDWKQGQSRDKRIRSLGQVLQSASLFFRPWLTHWQKYIITLQSHLKSTNLLMSRNFELFCMIYAVTFHLKNFSLVLHTVTYKVIYIRLNARPMPSYFLCRFFFKFMKSKLFVRDVSLKMLCEKIM